RLAVRAPSPDTADEFAGALRALGGDTLSLVDDDPDLVLALGEQAFRDALAAGGPPVLGLAVPRRAADHLVTDDCRCGAVWQGVPLDTQLALLRALLPEARRIGILRAPDSVWRAVPPAPPGLTLEAVTVPEPGRLGALLRRHLPDWDALLLPEDGALFDGGAARLVLLTSYRQRVPVVGPDGAYVRAGSVASARVLLTDLAAAALDAVHAHQRLGHWPAPGFAGHYSLAVNEHVAGAYDLGPVDRAPLERILEATP
uniref:hypothetical protein n=1 Tax=Alloalcanivorax venustensis TaxID=172371 RepID=UPI003514DAC2